MTEPTLPAPQPDSVATRRRLSRTWLIAIAGSGLLVLVLGGAAYGLHANGDAKAKNYAKAVAAWHDQRSDLLGAPSEANRGLWELTDDPTTKKSIASQKTACEGVETLRASAAKSGAAVPKVDKGAFDFLSSAKREAVKDSAGRTKAVKAYTDAANKVLVQMHKDCLWNIDFNSRQASKSDTYRDQAEKLNLKHGQSEGAFYCPSGGKVDCLPATAAKRAKYAELTLKANRLDETNFLKSFASGGCSSTSYAALCKDLKANGMAFLSNEKRWAKFVKVADPTSIRVNQESARRTKSNKAADKAYKVAVFKAHPGFKDDDRLTSNPLWNEVFFDDAAVAANDGLKKLRDAVLDEPEDQAV